MPHQAENLTMAQQRFPHRNIDFVAENLFRPFCSSNQEYGIEPKFPKRIEQYKNSENKAERLEFLQKYK